MPRAESALTQQISELILNHFAVIDKFSTPIRSFFYLRIHSRSAWWPPLAAAVLLGAAALASAAQDEQARPPDEIYSTHARVFDPVGEFAQELIRVAPATEWTAAHVYDLLIPLPPAWKVDPEKTSGPVAVFRPGDEMPGKARLRLDVVASPRDGYGKTDRKFARGYALAASRQTVGQGFDLTDSGLLDAKKGEKIAFAGGRYRLDSELMYRLQAVRRHGGYDVMITLDVPDAEWVVFRKGMAESLLGIRPAPRRN